MTSDHIRAPSVASWLRQLGHETYVLDVSTAPEILPVSPRQWSGTFAKSAITASELARQMAEQQTIVIDLGPSMDFRRGHIPGARWGTRRDLAQKVTLMLNERPDTRYVVLMADDDQKAQLAMTELEGLVQEKQCLLQFLTGGLRAWQADNLPVEATPDQPPNVDCIDFLFFVHDRHSGNREAMRQYLAWETGLMAQVTEDDKKLFTLYEQAHGE